MQKPVAAFDVAKESSNLCLLSPSNEILFQGIDIPHNKAGFKQLLSLLAVAEKKYQCRPVCIMEATGHYHRILFDLLQGAGFELTLVNPIQSDAIQNINVRGAKTDTIDAYHLALLYRLNVVKTGHLPEEAILEIRTMCRQYFSLSDTLAEYKLRARSLLDQLFPYFEKVFSDPFGSGARFILKHIYGTSQFSDLLSLTHNLAKCSSRSDSWAHNKLFRLQQSATVAPGVQIGRKSLACAFLSNLTIVETLEQELNSLNNHIKEQVRDLDDYHYLLTIPGMGPITAATILAEIGSCSWFKTSKQLTAFAGLDPRVRQSGKFCGSRSKMSKRGSPYLRRVLFLLAMASIRRKPNKQPVNVILQNYYQNKVSNGKAKMAALGSIMRKLLCYIFAVLRDKKTFEYQASSEKSPIVAA